MKTEFRNKLLKKLKYHGISFGTICEIVNKGSKEKLSYQVVYNVLNGRQADKNQRVLNAALKSIGHAKAADELTEELLNL